MMTKKKKEEGKSVDGRCKDPEKKSACKYMMKVLRHYEN